ncbi:hypothetical protein P7K49_014847, partial [Saguinus oedipus]
MLIFYNSREKNKEIDEKEWELDQSRSRVRLVSPGGLAACLHPLCWDFPLHKKK